MKTFGGIVFSALIGVIFGVSFGFIFDASFGWLIAVLLFMFSLDMIFNSTKDDK